MPEENMTPLSRNNRTWLCSVLFMDIVGYSTLSVDQQMMVKQSFSTLVSDALRGLTNEDCIKLDTGDGIAMCYLGAPEDVLYIAIGLRDAFIEVKALCETCYSVRLGINLGPVKILEDINGHRNIIGEAINVAQRVMSFARPNQLLVSRTYYDVVSCLSEDNPKMFTYIGVHKDKHVRQHAVYAVISPGAGGQQAQDTAVNDENSPEPVSQLEAQQGSGDLDERILQIVQDQLALIIGPMARILVKRAMKQSSSLDQLYAILAEDIPTDQERERFLESRDRLH
jgi:class 3 adenylate cyclase